MDLGAHIDRGAPRPALVAGVACGLGLALTGLVAHLNHGVEARDALSLHGFMSVADLPRVSSMADLIAASVGPIPYLLVGALLIGAAVRRGLPRVGFGVAVVLIGAAATSEVLKPMVSHPRYSEWLGDFQIRAASWPSGHATTAMALALCAVLVAPPRQRSLVAVFGGALAIAVSYSILMLAWHFPSDVLGGFLVAAMWTAFVVAALRHADRRWPARSARLAVSRAGTRLTASSPGTVGLAALGLVGLVALPAVATGYTAGHKSFVAMAVLIAAAAWSLAAGLVAVLRESA